jgi:hypothetical protein
MNTYLLLLLELLISVGASLLVLRILANPLIKTLGRICPDEESAGFWLSYTQVMLVIAPLILVLLMDLFSRYGTPQDSLRMALLATLGGLLAGLQLIGSRLGRFITVPEQKEAAQ